jgi:hypothetical protein
MDRNFPVLGVIDWEGASTVPWELVEIPLIWGLSLKKWMLFRPMIQTVSH